MSSDQVRCYVASPFGFSEAGRHYYATVLLPALEKVIEPVDPWELTAETELGAATGDEEERRAKAIGEANVRALRTCQLLVAVLDGQEIDAGTAAEVGYASALGLTCFGLRSDYRQTGEPGATVNLQVEFFIVQSGGRIAASLEALVSDLAEAVRKARQRSSH